MRRKPLLCIVGICCVELSTSFVHFPICTEDPFTFAVIYCPISSFTGYQGYWLSRRRTVTVKLVVKLEIAKKRILWILYQLKCHLIMSKLLSFSLPILLSTWQTELQELTRHILLLFLWEIFLLLSMKFVRTFCCGFVNYAWNLFENKMVQPEKDSFSQVHSFLTGDFTS